MLWMISAPALAATVTIDKKGLLPAYVFVDGVARGKVTKKDNTSIELPEGPHELWFSRDEAGVYTACSGLVTGAVAIEVGDQKCTGISEGSSEKTWAKGATLSINGADANAWITIDGLPKFTLLPAGLRANLAPGVHTVVVESGDRVLCQGKVTLDAGETSNVAITPAGCTGFDGEIRLVP